MWLILLTLVTFTKISLQNRYFLYCICGSVRQQLLPGKHNKEKQKQKRKAFTVEAEKQFPHRGGVFSLLVKGTFFALYLVLSFYKAVASWEQVLLSPVRHLGIYWGERNSLLDVVGQRRDSGEDCRGQALDGGWTYPCHWEQCVAGRRCSGIYWPSR